MSKTYITKPILPDFDDYSSSLKSLWESRYLTNHGPFVQKLESNLRDHLRVKNLSLINNGTSALMLALKALDIKGEVITTPFTFAATNTVFSWLGITPVFCDIDTETLCIDPKKIEEKITDKTEAIMGVHVYGIPCAVKEIKEIAKKHNLKVIYDAAHTFGPQNHEIYTYGDATILSFHATKLFHTVEGGAIITPDESLSKKINLLRNFGIENEESIPFAGINAKMNELQAIMGLENLKILPDELEKRQKVKTIYNNALNVKKGLKLISSLSNNLFYYPIQINAQDYGISRDALAKKLSENNIIARKYFFPLCSDLPFFKDLPSSRKENLENAHQASEEILCIPFYGDLEQEKLTKIINIVVNKQN